ncbi:hypothetical protein GGU45_000069 [Niabella hirudinis]
MKNLILLLALLFCNNSINAQKEPPTPALAQQTICPNFLAVLSPACSAFFACILAGLKYNKWCYSFQNLAAID